MSKTTIIATLAIGFLSGTSGMNASQYGDPNPFDPRTGLESSTPEEQNDDIYSKPDVNEEDE